MKILKNITHLFRLYLFKNSDHKNSYKHILLSSYLYVKILNHIHTIISIKHERKKKKKENKNQQNIK